MTRRMWRQGNRCMDHKRRYVSSSRWKSHRTHYERDEIVNMLMANMPALLNFALPKRKAKKTERQPNTRRDSRRVTPRAPARETTDGDAREWRADREPQSSTRRDRRRVTQWAATSENSDATHGSGARTNLKRTHDTSHAVTLCGRPRVRTQMTTRVTGS